MDTAPVFLFILIVFANRYIFGLYLRLVKGRRFDVARDDYEPTVSVVVPLFNEGRSIFDTIVSLMQLDYPPEKLTATIVDDCSTDDSYEWACRAALVYPGRVRVLQNPHNMGKRKGINHAVREAVEAEIIVSVDSDVIVDPQAVRQLVRRFTADDIAAIVMRVL